MGVPGEEGGTEGGAKQAQQGWQVLLCMCAQGSQAISYFYQPQPLTSKPQCLQETPHLLSVQASRHQGTSGISYIKTW